MKIIRGALARGYCTERNKHKRMDPDLIEDMLTELRKIRLTGVESCLAPKLQALNINNVEIQDNEDLFDLIAEHRIAINQIIDVMRGEA